MPETLFRKSELRFFKSVSKIGIAILFFIISLTIISIGMKPYFVKMQEGDISLSTIYAPFDFSYPGDIDQEKTEMARKKVAESVPPVYDVNHTVKETIEKDIRGLFKNIYAVRKQEALSLQEKVESLKPRIPVELSEGTLTTLIGQTDLSVVEKKLDRFLDRIYDRSILDASSKTKLAEQGKGRIRIRDSKRGKEETVDVQDLERPRDIRNRLDRALLEAAVSDVRLKKVFHEILLGIVKPNMSFNEAETKSRQDRAARSSPPIYKELRTKKNEIIIQKGQRVLREHILQLNQLKKAEGLTNMASYLGGIAFLLVIFILIFSIYMKLREPRFMETPKELILTTLISLIAIAIFKTVQMMPFPSYIVPFSSAIMLIAILISPTASMIACTLLSILTGIIFGGRLEIMLVSMVGGLVGIYATRNIRRRFEIAIAGFVVGLANAVVIVSLGLINNLQPRAYFWDSLWGIANGLISGFIVMGLLPIFEHLFKITTNITLLELSDLNHPLLKELTLKAPGTYHHSLLVGNLAEAACDAIGANSLLARIGSYYHDIGKIEKAEYFSENETSQKSRHEDLLPSMSTLVIGNHVKDGVEMAKRHKLNKPIIDIIRQHHGTGLMYFFYKKALENSERESQLKEDEYRYPGPKPQTKEAAVVLLADAVEATSRTMTDPTPGKIRNLVQRIVNNKFIDKQLDESDLTLHDLHKISESFVRVLTAAFHVRVEYPEQGKETVAGQGDGSIFKNKDKKSK